MPIYERELQGMNCCLCGGAHNLHDCDADSDEVEDTVWGDGDLDLGLFDEQGC